MRSPRFLYSKTNSQCCRHSALLVRSRAGGFISRNCLKCGAPSYVTPSDLPDLRCDHSGRVLDVKKVDGTNYFYVCDQCEKHWQLGSVLPDWSELFAYSGLAAHGDPGVDPST